MLIWGTRIKKNSKNSLLKVKALKMFQREATEE